MARTAAAAALALLALLSACGSGDQKLVPVDRLPRLVLEPSDLAAGFARFDHGEIGLTDFQPGPRQDPRRFGRQGGWKARYKRSGAAEMRGALVVVSMADVFTTEGGAEDDLAAYRRDLERRVAASGADAEPVRTPTLGDGSAAMTLLQGSASAGVRYYTIAWREANVTASVAVQGLAGKVSLDDALTLARRQQRRIERAR